LSGPFPVTGVLNSAVTVPPNTEKHCGAANAEPFAHSTETTAAIAIQRFVLIPQFTPLFEIHQLTVNFPIQTD
jgi:hypothetical protein